MDSRYIVRVCYAVINICSIFEFVCQQKWYSIENTSVVHIVAPINVLPASRMRISKRPFIEWNAQWVEMTWNRRIHFIDINLFPMSSRVSE